MVLRDLEHKARHSACLECRRHNALTVACSYWIGFGCLRDEKMKDHWLKTAGMAQVDVDALVNRISQEYQALNRIPEYVRNELWVVVLQTADRTEEYQASGRLYEAETRLSAETQARKAVFGNLHPSVARLQAELAQVLQKQMRYEEAEECQKTVVQAIEKAHGMDHTKSAMARLALAEIWTLQGFPQKARSVQIQDIALLRERIGIAEHPDILTAMQHELFTLLSQGHMDEAEDIARQLIAISSQDFGPEHPVTIKSQLYLVRILRAHGHVTEAVELMRSIEAKMGGTLKGERLTCAVILMAQALLYRDLSLKDDAMEKIQKAHEFLDKIQLDPHDSLRVRAYEVEAHIHHASHQFAQEEALLRQIIRGWGSEPLGNKASRAGTLAYLASSILWQGRHSEARKVADDIIQSLGPTPLRVHVGSYVSSMCIIAEALSAEGQQTAAEETLRRTYQACSDEFGQGHPTTIQAAASLCGFWNQQRRYSESQECLEHILDRLRHRPGTSAIQVARLLAEIHRERGQFERAANLCSEAAQWASAASGDTHDDMLTTLNTLASILIRTEHFDDAESILLKIDAQCRHRRLSGFIKMNMRHLRTQQGRHQEALELAAEAKRLLEDTYDPIDRLIEEANVIRARLRVEGLTDDVEQDFLKNIQRRGEIQGERSAGRIAMMADLAYEYGIMKRFSEAKALSDQINVLGGIDEREQPAECATVLCKQADICFGMDQPEEAETLQRRALDIRQRINGADHRLTLLTKSNLASMLITFKRYSDAEVLLREILKVRARQAVPGQPGNPEATTSPLNAQRLSEAKKLALVLYAQGQLAESLHLFEDALATALAAGGPPVMVAELRADVDRVRLRIAKATGN